MSPWDLGEWVMGNPPWGGRNLGYLLPEHSI